MFFFTGLPVLNAYVPFSIHSVAGWQGCLLCLRLGRCAEETSALGQGPASHHSFLCRQMQRQPGCCYDTGIPGNWLWLCKQGACLKVFTELGVLRITQYNALLMISWNCIGSSSDCWHCPPLDGDSAGSVSGSGSKQNYLCQPLQASFSDQVCVCPWGPNDDFW